MFRKRSRIFGAAFACLVFTVSDAQADGAPELMQGAGCMACHSVDKKLVGPAFSWIAHRYKGDKSSVPKLTKKIQAGGAGNWNALTGGVPMPPHPQISVEQATIMVKWILSQKPVPAPK